MMIILDQAQLDAWSSGFGLGCAYEVRLMTFTSGLMLTHLAEACHVHIDTQMINTQRCGMEEYRT